MIKKGIIMDTLDKEIVNDKLTQADLIKLMLHNAQHMATREEVKEDISKVETSLKEDISRVETNLIKVEKGLKEDISRVETSLKEDITKVETRLENRFDMLEVKILKIDNKFDKILWLILATTITILLKEKILLLLNIAN